MTHLSFAKSVSSIFLEQKATEIELVVLVTFVFFCSKNSCHVLKRVVELRGEGGPAELFGQAASAIGVAPPEGLLVHLARAIGELLRERFGVKLSVAGADVPVPYNRTLENAALPDVEDVIEAVQGAFSQ